ncbi:hypothetical protein BVX97_03925, partial [bacterium E08(2017)]
MPDKMDAFIRGADRMPSLPAAMGRLLTTIKDPAVSSKVIEDLITPDATLSAKILRLSNSAFYHRMEKVTNVSDALLRLGFKTTRSLVVTVWTHTLKAFGSFDTDENILTDLLNHGTACAVITKRLLDKVDPSISEDAFVAALLHDMGRVALVCQMGYEYRDKIISPAETAGATLNKAEIIALGFDHTQLGEHLMKKWNLPDAYCHIALTHHEDDVDAALYPDLAAVVLADYLSMKIGYNIALELPRK